MRFGFVLSAFMLFATIMEPAHAFPSNTGGACDIARVTKHSKTGNTQATRLQVSAASVAPGGTTTITMSNANTGFTGFLLYVNSPGQTGAAAHAGQLASMGQAQTASVFCNNGPAAGTTVAHNSPTSKNALSWIWTAPTQPGAYKVTALVAESANGVPALFNVAPVTITVAAAAPATTAPTAAPTAAPTTKAPTLPPATRTPTLPPASAPTRAPATPTTAPAVPTDAPAAPTDAPAAAPTDAPAAPTDAPPAPTTAVATAAPDTTTPTGSPSNTAQQAFNMVLVRLQAVLDGTGSVSQLKAAIQNLMAQIQAAIQKAKAAKGTPNANKQVKMIVTKAPANQQAAAVAAAAAAAAGGAFNSMNLLVGFADAADAVLFADMVTKSSSPDPAVRSQSTLSTSGDLAAQLQANPNGVDQTTGQVTVTEAQQVALVTCPDGTQVSQDMMAVMCPAAAAPAAPAAAAGPAVPLSNGAFIGIIAGGVVLLLLVVGGLVYYQKAKSKSTSVAPRV